MQLAHFLGSLGLLGAAGLALLAAGVAVYALTAGKRMLALLAVGAGATLVTLYAAVLLVSPLLATGRVLPVGSEISFCGLDCHLHVSVGGVVAPSPGSSAYAVRIRLRSNAVRAPEHPSLLRFRLVDAGGAEVAPAAAEGLAEPLLAGEQREIVLRFPVTGPLRQPRLRVTWSTWPDYLILGPAGTLVRRMTLLALPGAGETAS